MTQDIKQLGRGGTRYWGYIVYKISNNIIYLKKPKNTPFTSPHLNPLIRTSGVPLSCLVASLVFNTLHAIMGHMRRIFIMITDSVELVVARKCAADPKMSPSGAYLDILHRYLGLAPRPTRAAKALKSVIEMTKELSSEEVINAEWERVAAERAKNAKNRTKSNAGT